MRDGQSEGGLCNQSFLPTAVPFVYVRVRGSTACTGTHKPLCPPVPPLSHPGSSVPLSKKGVAALVTSTPASPPNKGCSVWATAVSCSAASSSGPEHNCCCAGSSEGPALHLIQNIFNCALQDSALKPGAGGIRFFSIYRELKWHNMKTSVGLKQSGKAFHN